MRQKTLNYAKSKLQGERQVLNNFPLATILDLIVYSVDDNFTTNFMTLNRFLFSTLR